MKVTICMIITEVTTQVLTAAVSRMAFAGSQLSEKRWSIASVMITTPVHQIHCDGLLTLFMSILSKYHHFSTALYIFLCPSSIISLLACF